MIRNKIYISLPMAGREDTVWERFTNAVNYIKNHPIYSTYDIIEPIDILDFNPDAPKIEKESHTYGWYLGRDIERLCDCTHILITEGWENSRGCRVEIETAKILGITEIYI